MSVIYQIIKIYNRFLNNTITSEDLINEIDIILPKQSMCHTKPNSFYYIKILSILFINDKWNMCVNTTKRIRPKHIIKIAAYITNTNYYLSYTIASFLLSTLKASKFIINLILCKFNNKTLVEISFPPHIYPISYINQLRMMLGKNTQTKKYLI